MTVEPAHESGAQNRRLAGLLREVLATPASSPREGVADTFRRALDTPLSELFDSDEARDRFRNGFCQPGAVPPFLSVADVLSAPSPPLELLRLVKDHAKAQRQRGSGTHPEAATALYFLALAVEWVAHGTKSTGLDDATLRTGFHWVLAREWIDESTKEVLSAAVARLG